MPNYPYSCESCGHQWTAEQRITAEPLTLCPKCGRAEAKRQIAETSFVLKGTGWTGKELRK